MAAPCNYSKNCILTQLFKLIIEKVSSHYADSLISEKYKKSDGGLTDEGKIYSGKISSNIFKCLYNLFIAIFGYFVLNQLKYFPSELLGNGDMYRMFEDKFPYFYFHYKPKYFDFLYLINFSYYTADFIWLIWISEKTNDFVLIIIHHICTMVLIFFSFWTNNSNIGCLIFYLHSIGNVFIYLLRVFLYSRISSIIKALMTLILIVVLIYTRLFVFGKFIMLIWNYLNPWSLATYVLWPQTVILYFLHVFWIFEILKKLLLLVKTNTVEDVSK